MKQSRLVIVGGFFYLFDKLRQNIIALTLLLHKAQMGQEFCLDLLSATDRFAFRVSVDQDFRHECHELHEKHVLNS